MDTLEKQTCCPYKLNPLMTCDPGVDDPTINKFKIKFVDNFKDYLAYIQPRCVHSFLKHTSLAASQVLHFNELNTTSNTYYAFTAGHSNILHIIRGGSQNRGNDIGQSFFTIFITDNISWVNEVYGNIQITEVQVPNLTCKRYYICQTPWVRLSSERLTFMKDQYYSILSTSFDTFSRIKDQVFEKGFFKTCINF
jgi:hypothetical protein